MTGYAGYTGYSEDSVRRQRAMADALMQRSQQPRKIEHWTQGAAQLAEALFARQAMDNADKSEKSYKTNQQQIADALIGNAFPDAQTASATELAAPAAYDLTPKAAESRAATASLGNQVKLMANLTGNPLQAMQYGQGVLAARQADNRYRDETQYARGRDLVGDQKDDRNFGLQEDQFGFQKDSWKQGFDQDASQFDATMGMNKDQFGQTMAYNYAKLEADREADALKAAAAGAPKSEDIGTLRKEWNSQASDFRGVRDAFSRVQASGDGTTPAQQMSMIFAYMKMLDPTSAVRETEYANAENARGVPTAVQNIWNKLKDGQFLAPSQITDFKNQASALYENAEQDYDRSFNFYRKQAENAGMSPDVIQDFRVPEETAPTGAPPATITAPDGKTFSREQAISAQNFMASLPPHMQDPEFMAQIEALLSQPAPAVEPTDDDLVKKWTR